MYMTAYFPTYLDSLIGKRLWVEPKHCDDTIIYARIGEDNAKA